MPDRALMDDRATQVGFAWLMKEIFAFLIKWRKADADDRPSDTWKDFIREQFSDIKDRMGKLEQKVELLDDKIQDLKLEHRTCGGKD